VHKLSYLVEKKYRPITALLGNNGPNNGTLKWFVLIADFFQPKLKEKAWNFLSNILNSTEKDIRSALSHRRLITVELLDLCREKSMTTRQASLYSMCKDYNNIYVKCLSHLNSSHAKFALFVLLLLLSGERPGSGSNFGLASLNYDNITISENGGIRRLQFTGSLKSSNFSSKTIF
jgi:hypothetical protein